MPLQIRRGTTAERTSITPLAGELIYDTTLGSVYIGDNATAGGVGVTGFTTEDAVDAVGAALVAGTHSGITFTYGVTQDNAGRIDATIGGGVVNLDIRGSVFSDDSSTILIDSVLAAINLDQTIKSNVVPALNITYDLGTASHRFKDIYLSGSSIFLGNATITSTGSAVNLPTGSTVGGVPIGSGSGTGDGVIEGSTYKINIAADDSSLMIDTDAETITASGGIVGNVTGNTFGVHTGTVLGNVFGNISGNVFGSLNGDVRGSVFGDDSSKIVDSVENKVYAEFFGNLTGNTIGTHTGSVTGNIIGNSNIDVNGYAIVRSANLNPVEIISITSGDGAVLPYLRLRSSKGTVASPTTTSAGDLLFGLTFDGYANGDYMAAAAMIVQWANSAVLTDDNPKSIFTIATGAGGVDIHNFVFDDKGALTAPIFKATSYATSSLPSSPEEGWMVFDSDTKQFKGWNGTSWAVLG